MLHVIEHSNDPAIRQLRQNYTSPSEATAVIDPVIRITLKNCPFVVIDVTTGHLCDGPERTRIFKADSSFRELISCMTRGANQEHIHHVVTGFFSYVMFSHVWQGNEPSLQEVNSVKSVWNLPNTDSCEKLRNFCKETGRLGYRWAWSDTCCIDKTTDRILSESLTSMYKWYMDSAATLVFLAGVPHPSKPKDLPRSKWMTRAWTLQEFLAPKVILFYDSEWKPYLGNTGTNHKECPEIMQELADAIKISCGNIVTFSPRGLRVREKLRLASTRNATVEEDVAYSLIGIFESDIKPHYGERGNALGHLLEEIVTRSGDDTVLAWSGKSSSYHSCLPASISVYNQTPYSPPLLEGEAMKTCITELLDDDKLLEEEALNIYKQIKSLPAARFAARRLYLPCIVFPVRGFIPRVNGKQDGKRYRAKVSGLKGVDVTTMDNIILDKQRRFVLVHPWIRYVRGRHNGVNGEFHSGSDTDTDSGVDVSARWHPVAPPRAAPPPLVGRYARALEMIARLAQPFHALLLVQQPGGEYKRVAADNDILVPGLRTDIDPRDIRARVLEIL
ncbi:hypothetical protein PISMIDRAFT_463973 [Pisolithus microcarpus 441]|uniref:Heterokaryon incompatibility domain-containing protein n=1 Tax=Pisolithus microcarpus 441 TaxID=765257 RepID=A0A0C9YE54_9AGAM|nr:hypothetical protein PISMIDRAFT_463973 [Pisolithus microcarpus 441]